MLSPLLATMNGNLPLQICYWGLTVSLMEPQMLLRGSWGWWVACLVLGVFVIEFVMVMTKVGTLFD